MQGEAVSLKERHASVLHRLRMCHLEAPVSRTLLPFASRCACAVALCIALTPLVARADDPAAYASWTAGATPQRGLFTIWHKSGHIYLELQPNQLDRDYVQSIVPGNGLGGWFVEWGNTDYLPAELVRFRRAGNQVAIVWLSASFTAPEGSPVSRSIDRSLPSSIMGLAQIVAEDAQTGAIVIDTAPFASDMLDMHDLLRNSLGIDDPSAQYSLNPDLSYIGETKAFPRNVVIDAEQDWVTDTPSVVDVAPDNRNLQMRIVYNIADPPGDDGYRPRYADDRVGIYDDVYYDFGNDARSGRLLRYVIRWNIQPSDPSMRLSPATHPMVFYLSNTIPTAYRPAIRRAVLTWNQAFEKIGISDALQVRDQPDDPDWDPDDIRYNVIRWVSDVRATYGADSQTLYDPRTGEEFRTGILVSANSGVGPRTQWKYVVDPVRYGRVTDPVPQWFIDDSFMSEILHETGHNLGMQHNFIGSTAYTARDLQDPSFTSRYGIASTVMEYAPLNIWPKNDRQGSYYQTVLGPYDYYAIKYTYAPIPGANTPEAELPTLERWASAWSDPRYRYGSDEDVSWADGHAADPRIEQGDLTDDPLGWCQTQMQITSGLMASLHAHFPAPGAAFEDERTAFTRLLATVTRCNNIASHFIGGQYLSRAHRGDSGAQPAVVPVPRAEQQRAFAFLDRYAFGQSAWQIPPPLLADLGYSEWSGYASVQVPGYGQLPAWAYTPPAQHYESISGIAAADRQALIGFMFSPAVLTRLEDAPSMSSPGRTATLGDLFSWMYDAAFAEIGGRPASIGALRRDLQTEYEQTLVALATAPQKGTPDDAQALARADLSRLSDACASASRSSALDSMTRSHLTMLRARAMAAIK